ncbi:MAG TPA: glutamine--fructose-6-phosphate aminotransferase, partial [Brevundimonas sp.]|nr:glutamine--fructose-6-phosphate aminotransferase [Brevundimonas sp.]
SLAVAAGVARGRIDAVQEAELVKALFEAPRLISEALQMDAGIHALTLDLAKARDVLFLGRGPMFPLAMEGALKLKEISYIHAEGYAAGELKHGPIALIDEATPTVALAPLDDLFEKTASNLQEVAARCGPVIMITLETAPALHGAGVRRVHAPDCPALIAPLVYAVPMQLLAYYTAVQKGTDVDQPRNLAKSVTVE